MTMAMVALLLSVAPGAMPGSEAVVATEARAARPVPGPIRRWKELLQRPALPVAWTLASMVVGLGAGFVRTRGQRRRELALWALAPGVAALLTTLVGVLINWPGTWSERLQVQGVVTVVLGVLAFLNRSGIGQATAGAGELAKLHGSAEWASASDMRSAGRLLRRGVVEPKSFGFALGRVADAGWGDDPRLRYMGHLITCAPTGAGKGVGAVIPNLLEYPGSVFVLDVKGENYMVTARARAAMGQQVVLIDPFGVTRAMGCRQRAQGCNWLDTLDLQDPDVVSASAVLADLIVYSEGNTADPYWDDAARDLLRGLILYVATLPKKRRNIGEVRRLLSEGEEALEATMAAMMGTRSPGNVVARAAHTFSAKPEKERGSVLSMAQRHTAFLDDPRVADCLSRSDFQFADLKASPVSVYLVIPPAKISAYNRLLRGFVGLGIGAMTAGTARSPWKVAFLLDEFASLGRMQVVEESIAILRGYGVALWLFVQDLSQLQKVYPKADSLLANAAKQFWSTSDLETAKYVSGMLGQKTISYESKSEGTATLASILKGQAGGGGSKNLQHAGRALLLPEEIMRLGGKPIVLIQGERPYLLERLSYFRDREYQGLASDNPYQAAFVEQAGARQPAREVAPERTPEGRAR